MYELLTQREADQIKFILENSPLLKPIEHQFFSGKYSLNVFDLSESYDVSEYYDRNMHGFMLLDETGNKKVLKYRNSHYECFIHYGEWGGETRLQSAHITVGYSKHEYNFQIELSQAITDENYIYVVKNVSNLAGEGALVRLYRNLKDDRISKETRRERFISEFNGDIISYDKKEWIVISKISKEDLFNSKMLDKVFHDLLSGILKAMLLVEAIGEEE